MSKHEKKTAWIMAIFYFIWNKCFNLYLFADNVKYDQIKEVIVLFFVILFLPALKKSLTRSFPAQYVSYLLILYIFSIVPAYIFWNQGLYASIRALCGGFFPLVLFFILNRYQVTICSIAYALSLICIIYAVCQIVGTLTFPHHIFGNTGNSAMEKSMQDLEARGLLRLAVPGADFIVMAIFMVITYFRKKKRWYFLLIPLGLLLLMRGTRTPFFATTALCVGYFILSIKRKWIAIVVGLVIYAIASFGYNAILNSKSNNPIVNYIQLTESQLDNGDADIRVQMTNYYLRTFNDGNILKNILGNGVPGFSSYGDIIQFNGEKQYYWVVDVGFTQIFVYFGIVGLFLYLRLFICIIFSKISQEALFAKMTMLYSFIILPTNNMLLSRPIVIAVTLYVIFIGYEGKKHLIRHKQ